jgi:hypothetical protein
MEKTPLIKHLSYAIALIIFLVIPALVNAQKKCPDGSNCPKGYYCSDGRCVKFWTGPVCPSCPWQIIYNYGSQSASISFSLDKPEKILVKIFDMTGRLMKTLADKNFQQGSHELQWNVAGAKAGIYIVQLDTGTYSETKKISVVK